MNIYDVAAIWLGMALIASVVSIRIAMPAALVEIVIARWPGTPQGRGRRYLRSRHQPTLAARSS